MRCWSPSGPQSAARLTTRSGAKKNVGRGPGSESGTGPCVVVRGADDGGVGELVAEVIVHGGAQLGVASDVHVHGAPGGQRVELVVGETWSYTPSVRVNSALRDEVSPTTSMPSRSDSR